jgi:hypothetical protein
MTFTLSALFSPKFKYIKIISYNISIPNKKYVVTNLRSYIGDNVRDIHWTQKIQNLFRYEEFYDCKHFYWDFLIFRTIPIQNIWKKMNKEWKCLYANRCHEFHHIFSSVTCSLVFHYSCWLTRTVIGLTSLSATGITRCLVWVNLGNIHNYAGIK